MGTCKAGTKPTQPKSLVTNKYTSGDEATTYHQQVGPLHASGVGLHASSSQVHISHWLFPHAIQKILYVSTVPTMSCHLVADALIERGS